ncbi:MAG: glycosyltransferase [Planctomycetes bacterium]|nr:glycosyltransferase [Planctomycetota bacterium]
MKLSVIVPAYNEARTIRTLIARVLDVQLDKEVLVVDDGSTDGTREILRQITHPQLRVLFHERNQGKGAAVRTGIQAAAGEIVLIQDADLEYDPREYPQLIRPIEDGTADVVYGSRFLGSPRRVLYFWHYLANRFLTLLCNACTDLTFTDMETCYKVFRADVIKAIPLRADGFDFEPEITAKVAKMGCRIYEVGISYRGRDYSEGKKIRWYHGFQAIWTLVKFSLVDDLESVGPEYETLRVMSRLRRYNEWLWRRIRPYIGQRILEIGAGTGTFTSYLLGREFVAATDINPHYIRILRTRVRPDEALVDQLDVNQLGATPLWERRFDTVICMNLVEHVERDEELLRAACERMPPGCRMIILVPAHPFLFGSLDRAVGHFRRYSRADLTAKIQAAGFELEHLSSFNVFGMAGWFVNGRILRRRRVPLFQARIFDLLVPLLRWEELLAPAIGISLIAVARKRP